MRKLFILSVLLLASVFLKAQNASQSLESVIQNIQGSLWTPSSADSLFQGLHPKGPFKLESSEARKAYANKLEELVQNLEKIPSDSLSRQEIISKKIMLFRLGDRLSDFNYKMYLIPMNAEGGFYNRIGERVLGNLPFNSEADYQAYINWVPKYMNYLKEHHDLLKQGIKSGIVAPRPVIDNAIKLMAPYLSNESGNNPYFKPFTQFPETFSAEQKEHWTQKGEALVKEHVVTYFKELVTFLDGTYRKASPSKPGIQFLTKGKEYYEDRVRFYTTFDISPDSVHAIGLQEVKRIRGRMEEVIQEVGFEGDFKAFLKFLRTDPQFYAKTPEELLEHAAWLSKRAEAGLPKLFNKLYSLPFTVAPVPDAIAPTYTGGRYVPGSWKQKRSGTYWVNTYKLESRPLYVLPALTLHEAVPGHHLHFALVSEMNDLPDFRRNYYISAFGEGWGLYSEYLGEEMGMYTTPYEQFGRYTYEMWRACRLVVDTGIHYMGWTRQEAIDFMASNTALSMHEVTTEIDRYIGWPGQALSYKMGELKIKELRQKAEKQLGEDFDIGVFHELVLRNGSVPLEILEEEVDNYLTAFKN